MEQLSEKLGDMEKSICRSIWKLRTVSRLFPCSSIKLVQTLLKGKRSGGCAVSGRIFLFQSVFSPKTFSLSRLYNGHWRLRKQTTDGKESSKTKLLNRHICLSLFVYRISFKTEGGVFIGHNKMVANGKLHSLQKIIFFFWRYFWNTVFALSECRALPIGKVLLIPTIY